MLIIKIVLRSISLIIFCLIISGCASLRTVVYFSSANRYDSIKKQNTYINVCFPMGAMELAGKTKNEVKSLLGEPAQVTKNVNGKKESWIYYPSHTQNFIAIIVTFEEEKVKNCSYNSLI